MAPAQILWHKAYPTQLDYNEAFRERTRRREEEKLLQSEKMPMMEKLKMLVVQEPVVAASCLIGGIGLLLPAVVRPMLDSWDASKQAPQPALSDVVAGATGKKHD